LVDEKLVRYRIEGGISRGKTLTARQYLSEHLPALSARTLPDAIQRLRDLEVVSPDAHTLRRLCLITLAEHEARITLPKAKGFGVEAALLRALRQGVRLEPLFKLYLKLRFLPVFDVYFHFKHGR
jgi:hypothetical protein